jgi:hypothetical protein
MSSSPRRIPGAVDHGAGLASEPAAEAPPSPLRKKNPGRSRAPGLFVVVAEPPARDERNLQCRSLISPQPRPRQESRARLPSRPRR